MGIWDKIKSKEYEEDEGFEEEVAEEEEREQPVKSSSPVSSFGKAGGSALELKVVRPETFDAAPQIADHLLNRRTVVLNLEAANKESAKRIIDFLSGVAYSIGGNIKRVATNTFIITPSNVGISGEQVNEAPRAQKAEASDEFSF